MEKLNRMIGKTNLTKLGPNQKIAAGFSSQFGNFPDMHSTDLESSIISGSKLEKLELFGKMAHTTTNKDTNSFNNRARLFSGDSGEYTER